MNNSNDIKHSKTDLYKKKLLKTLYMLIEENKLEKDDVINLLANCIVDVNSSTINNIKLEPISNVNDDNAADKGVLGDGCYTAVIGQATHIRSIKRNDRYLFISQSVLDNNICNSDIKCPNKQIE